MPIVIPDACTLPTVERPLRLAEFDALFATAVRRVDTVGPTHARLRLTGPAGLAATVRDLTARETECCSFFTFTVTPEPADQGEVLTLDVEVPAQYADVLASLAERAGTIALGHPSGEASTARMLAGAEDLGLDTDTLTTLAATWRDGYFPHQATSDEAALACDLVTDGGDAHHRIGVWQQALARVEHRDPLPDTADGVALRFPFDVDLAGTLARLAAAEYRCCSFGSYTLVIDGTGLRLEVRMPGEAAGMLAAVVGRPDTEASDAAVEEAR